MIILLAFLAGAILTAAGGLLAIWIHDTFLDAD